MPSKESKLEFKWTWISQMKSLIMFIESGNESNRKYAKEELMKLAEELDEYNNLVKDIKKENEQK
tara:strand:- start:669 stop:863 length:195 start_codon:yes stop_codon:yes gene_type:complete